MTPSSSLLQAHSPVPTPPRGFAPAMPWGLCRWLPAPAGRGTFPTLSLHSLCRCLDPYLAVSPLCTCPLLPEMQRPRPRCKELGTPKYPRQVASTGRPISRLQSFAHVQAPTLARPPDYSYRRRTRLLGSRAVYTAHSPVGYLPRVAASLHARHGQLAWRDFHPLECSLVGCSRTCWTTNKVSWSHLHPPIPFDPQGLVALNFLSADRTCTGWSAAVTGCTLLKPPYRVSTCCKRSLSSATRLSVIETKTDRETSGCMVPPSVSLATNAALLSRKSIHACCASLSLVCRVLLNWDSSC